MEQATERQRWLQAVCNLEQGARLNQLLSIMSGGQIAYVQWSFPLLQEGYQLPEDPAEYLQQQLSLSDLQTPWPQWDNLWHAAGITQERTGGTGVIMVLAYARQEEFDQAQLQQALSWLQQMQQQPFPVRLLLLAFPAPMIRMAPIRSCKHGNGKNCWKQAFRWSSVRQPCWRRYWYCLWWYIPNG